jgi:hypothetical protein
MRVHSLLVCLVLGLVACGDDGGPSGPPDAEPHPDGVPPAGCDPSGQTQCNNCVDDDHDGKIDGNDPECTGAADDDEGSFATGIPGDNMDDTWQDCFFDGNSGAGDDGCRYNTCCLFDPDCPDDPDGCTATQECIDNCAPLVPPNCDCFGCCTICDDAGCVDIVINPAIAPDCDESVIHDDTKCPVCVKTDVCGTTCPVDAAECDVDTACPEGEFCADGCCIAVVD